MKWIRAGLLAGAASVILAPAAHAAATQQQIDQLQQEVDSLSAQLSDLKRSTSAQYVDVQAKPADPDAVKVSLKGGKPVFKTADGNFTFEPRILVQYDSAYYAQGHVPGGVDFDSGSNFRRARFGVDGTLFKDWSYEFIYDFGGSGAETTGISSAYLQYNGLGDVHLKIGAYAPPESFDDTTAVTDLLFLERAQPTDLARGIAGSDGRDAATIFAYDDNYFAALSYTGGVTGQTAIFDEQQALVGRAAYRLVNTPDANLAIGADSSYVFKIGDLAPDTGLLNTFSLSERPELNVDDNNVKLISTGSLFASKVWQWGLEAAGNWKSLYGQGGYYNYHVDRNGLGVNDASFDGWYAQASWVLTGEERTYVPSKGSFAAPKPNNPFDFDQAGIGAWELAARYSVLNLDSDEGAAGFATPVNGVRGGEQKIWSAGISWYPNTAVRFMLDFQHTDVTRLDALGGNADAKLDAVSLRTQFAL
ncbi:MAG TPA: porin [Rhizomicrobium sp.]|nr:porin [Rhizomicrobium sp.]